MMKMSGSRALLMIGVAASALAAAPAFAADAAKATATTAPAADPTPATAPDGWAFFEFRMLDLGLGWTVDEATAWGADGAPLAISRQRRKLLPQRGA